MNEYVPVTRNTKAGRAGKKIRCPYCDKIARRIYHMSWSKITCINCHTEVSKYDWLIEVPIYR